MKLGIHGSPECTVEFFACNFTSSVNLINETVFLDLTPVRDMSVFYFGIMFRQQMFS